MYNYNYPPNFYFDGDNLRNYQKNNYYQNDNLFNPYEGLIRGNLFKNIYDPYKNQKPYAIKPMNDQAKMLIEQKNTLEHYADEIYFLKSKVQ